MNEQWKVCADFCHENRNCHYVKIVEEHGEYPVITFQAKEKNGVPDLTTMHNVKTRVDTTSFWVYCTHPSYPKEKFIGSVEPYFPCSVPRDCPELQKESKIVASKKLTLFEKFKKLLVK